LIDLNKIYYLVHPCTTGGSTMEENKASEQLAYEKIIAWYPGIKIIRPLQIIPDGMGHSEAMERCFKLLSGCDTGIFAGYWMISKGCKMEFEFCVTNKKGIIDFENLFDEVAV